MENITYEHLMRRGFKVDRYKRKGVDVDIYDGFGRDSFLHIQDPTNVKALRAFTKRRNEIKEYVGKALSHSLKRLQGNQNGTAEVNALILRTQQATTKADLDSIIEDGIETFNTHQINM